MMFLLRSPLSLLSAVAAISLLLLGSSSNAVVNAMSSTTTMDTPLPYSLFAGGDGCTDDTFVSTATTISLMAIENEYGSFCEIDEFPSPEINDTSAVTTLYTKIGISSCHLNTTGLIWMESYNCNDSGCGNCSDAIEFAGFWNLSSYKDNKPLSFTPNQDECFGFQSIAQNLTAFTATMSTDVQLALAENSTTIYQKFDMDSSITQGVEEYWKILYDHSCMGDDGSNSSDMASLSSTSLSIIDPPMGYIEFGNSNEPGTDACVESNALGSGTVSSSEIIKSEPDSEGDSFCETDNVILPDGSVITAYERITFYCEPPKEVANSPPSLLPPPGDVLYISFQSCNATDCSEESCGEKSIAYVDWSFVEDPAVYGVPGTCMGWKWFINPMVGENTDVFPGMTNITTGYFAFFNVTSEQLSRYWSFYYDNSCVATGTHNNYTDYTLAPTEASGSFITTLVMTTWTSTILLFVLAVYNN
jgi:hypothetical protein